MNPETPDISDLDWLYARQRFGVHPGLSRVRSLLARLGDPQTNFRSVLVGGTNGKGTTASVLAAMLTASGLRTALFTSPHLTRFTERFVVAGQELPAEAVQAALARVRPHAEALEASFFEIVTALGCLLFAEAGVELAVMEVGLGGRLDATNALEPVLSAVTTIGLDHTAILGDTLLLIAFEKAGILRAGTPAVTGVQPELLPILDERGADLWALEREATFAADSLGWDGAQVRLSSPAGALSFRTPLLGEHGARNAALAALAAVRLGVSEQAIQVGAAHAHWPGRLERLPWRGGAVLLDGAHNLDGARALRQALTALAAPPMPVIFGAASDKDVAAMLAELSPLMSSLILTRSALSPRAASPEALAAQLQLDIPVTVALTPQAALDRLPPSSSAPGGLSLVCGSLYLIGEIRPLLTGEQGEGRERWQ